MRNILWAFIIFITEFFIAYLALGELKYLACGSLVMLIIVSIIVFAVFSLTNQKNKILAILLMLAKYPIVAFLVYRLAQQEDFNVISFTIGVLILLPCLVFMSYRGFIK